jgi:hypothetical protein
MRKALVAASVALVTLLSIADDGAARGTKKSAQHSGKHIGARTGGYGSHGTGSVISKGYTGPSTHKHKRAAHIGLTSEFLAPGKGDRP